MFLGVVPEQVIEQMLRIVDFSQWPETYVCCSGGLRIERALAQTYPGIVLRSNDVSLFTTSMAKLALGQEMPVVFKDKLEWVEGELESGSFLERTAAMMVVFDMARFISGGRNRYKDAHVREYRRTFKDLVARTVPKLETVAQAIKITSYSGRDWRLHAAEAIGKGAGIAAFPPFFKGGYEKQFEYLHANIDWPAPSYDVYDPRDLTEEFNKIHDSGVPYCILTDQVIEGHKPVLEYIAGRRLPHYCYASTSHSSYRHFHPAPEQFPYKPVDMSKLTEKTKLRFVEADGRHVNFIKDIYLQRSIVHAPGMMNFLVYLDDMLVGGLVYTLPKWHVYDDDQKTAIYLLSDVTTSRHAKLSKLVSMVGASTAVLRKLNTRYLQRFNFVFTTAHSKHPMSMKYRGVYDLLSRRPADPPAEGYVLQYGRMATEQTPDELYAWWWQRYGRKAVEEAKAARTPKKAA